MLNGRTKANRMLLHAIEFPHHPSSAYGSHLLLLRTWEGNVAYAEQIEDTTSVQRELALAALELREAYDALDEMFFHDSDNHVYSVRLNRTKGTLDEIFTVQPLDVGKSLNESLYAETRSVIYASATLAVDGQFDAFECAVGFNNCPYKFDAIFKEIVANALVRFYRTVSAFLLHAGESSFLWHCPSGRLVP